MDNTVLNGRVLWFDGSSTIAQDLIEAAIMEGVSVKHIFVSEITDAIKKFNNLFEKDILTIKEHSDPIQKDWNIPEEYKDKDIRKHIYELLTIDISKFPEPDRTIRLDRLNYEIDLFFNSGLEDVIRVMIYIIDTFTTNSIVWGVGRGSSVSSYLLYLIGVHDVDPILYNLDIHEFIKKEK